MVPSLQITLKICLKWQTAQTFSRVAYTLKTGKANLRSLQTGITEQLSGLWHSGRSLPPPGFGETQAEQETDVLLVGGSQQGTCFPPTSVSRQLLLPLGDFSGAFALRSALFPRAQ